MTPKEKAKELVNKYWEDIPDIFFEDAKQCALIAVDEILEKENDFFQTQWHYNYWYNEVKQEIESL